MAYLRNGSGIYLPENALRYRLGRGLPPETQEALSHIISQFEQGKTACRTEELRQLAKLMDGGEEAIDDDSFPMPDGYDPLDWNEIRSRLMVLVNLFKASVRKVRSRVYGGYQHRAAVRNPYPAEIEKFMGGWYATDMRDWFTNRLAFSNAPCIVQGKVGRNGKRKLKLWLPDPCYTYIVPDPDDPREYLAVAEFSPCGGWFQFVTTHSEGRIVAGDEPVMVTKLSEVPASGSYILITDMGFLPAVIGHGESRRNRRQPYSAPPFRDARKFTVRATDVMFNGSLLQKVQTKGLLAVSGLQEHQTMDFAEMMRQGIVYLDAEGKLQFISPTSNIKDTLDLLDRLIEVYSVVSAIPVDDLNPTSAKGTSAEEANRRAEPHLSLTREFAEVATLDEQELVLRATGVLQWMEPGTAEIIDIDDLREKVETDISLQPPLKPLTSQEDAQIAVMGHEAGAILDEDFARLWNPHAHKGKLEKVMANLKKKREMAEKALELKSQAQRGSTPAPGDDPELKKETA